jgi:hypothetical protein
MSQEQITQALDSLNQRLVDLETTNQNLAHQNQALLAAAANAPAPVLAPASAAKPPKLNPPTPFDGTASQYRTFMTQVTTVFAINPAGFNDDQIKIRYCYSFLCGRAANWATPILEAPERHVATMATWESFKTALRANYGPVDQVRNSSKALMKLQQTGTAVDYTAQFNVLAVDLEWNAAALMDRFEDGLSSKIKLAKVNYPAPATLHTLQTLAVTLDQLIRGVEDEIKGAAPRPAHHQPHVVPRLVNHQAPGPAANDAMDLDAMNAAPRPRAPLTAEEKGRRYRERLCMYCASPTHLRINCPIAPRP